MNPMHSMGRAFMPRFFLRPKMQASKEELRDYCRLRLNGFEVPEQIHIVASIPHTTKGSLIGGHLRINSLQRRDQTIKRIISL